jgi:hypothetical protein
VRSRRVMKWLADEFGWSHSTSLRYRSIYWLSQNRQIGDFEKWNISISALYLLSDNISWPTVRDAIVEAAGRGALLTRWFAPLSTNIRRLARRTPQCRRRKTSL